MSCRLKACHVDSRLPYERLQVLAAYASEKADYLTSKQAAEDLPPRDRTAMQRQYSLQLKYLHAMLDQHPSRNEGSVEEVPEYVSIQTSDGSSRMRLARQGPFLLQPSPIELDGSEESLATDIMCRRISDPSHADLAPVDCVLIAYSDGKVDVCIDVEKVEPGWSQSHDSSVSRSIFVKTQSERGS